MTGFAVISHTESSRTIMTGSAGRAVFHILHACLIGAALGFEQVGMAFTASKQLDMGGMGKNDIPRIFILV